MTAIACSGPAPLDMAAWAGMPVACVPIGADFVPLVIGQRLLVAKDGLYLEAASPVLYVRLRLSAVPTLWGETHPTIDLVHGKLPQSIISDLCELSLRAHPSEMAALVIADAGVPGAYRMHQPHGLGRVGAITYDDTAYPDGSLVVDAHSHGPYPAKFSSTDDDSDRSRLEPHISMVFGTCARAASLTVAARVCVGSYLLLLDDEQFSELIA